MGAVGHSGSQIIKDIIQAGRGTRENDGGLIPSTPTCVQEGRTNPPNEEGEEETERGMMGEKRAEKMKEEGGHEDEGDESPAHQEQV